MQITLLKQAVHLIWPAGLQARQRHLMSPALLTKREAHSFRRVPAPVIQLYISMVLPIRLLPFQRSQRVLLHTESVTLPVLRLPAQAQALRWATEH